MFGYIIPYKQELKIKEYELFRAYYCGLCKSMGKKSGQITRLFLNYDSTFFAVLLASISKDTADIRNERCVAHPIKKRLVAKDSDVLDYAADMNVLLAYFSGKDKWEDDKGVSGATTMLVLKRAMKRIKKKYPRKYGIIIGRLKELSALEKQGCKVLDEAADKFAKLMEEILCYDPICSGSNEKVLRWLGYNIGKWIYIIDAYDDLEQDANKGNYNPILLQYGEEYGYAGGDAVSGDVSGAALEKGAVGADAEKGAAGDIKEFREKIREKIEFNLTYAMSEISKAYEILEKNELAGIVENIIFMGMLKKTEEILGTGSCVKFE